MQVAKWCDSFFRMSLQSGRHNVDADKADQLWLPVFDVEALERR